MRWLFLFSAMRLWEYPTLNNHDTRKQRNNLGAWGSFCEIWIGEPKDVFSLKMHMHLSSSETSKIHNIWQIQSIIENLPTTSITSIDEASSKVYPNRTQDLTGHIRLWVPLTHPLAKAMSGPPTAWFQQKAIIRTWSSWRFGCIDCNHKLESQLLGKIAMNYN